MSLSQLPDEDRVAVGRQLRQIWKEVLVDSGFVCVHEETATRPAAWRHPLASQLFNDPYTTVTLLTAVRRRVGVASGPLQASPALFHEMRDLVEAMAFDHSIEWKLDIEREQHHALPHDKSARVIVRETYRRALWQSRDGVAPYRVTLDTVD